MEQPLRSREIVLCLWKIVPRRMSRHGVLSPMALQRRADDGAHVPAGAGEHLADGALAQGESTHPSWLGIPPDGDTPCPRMVCAWLQHGRPRHHPGYPP